MCILKYLLFGCVICIFCSHVFLHQKQWDVCLGFFSSKQKVT